MTTYGTIPTSSTGESNSEYLKLGLGELRPWKEMYNLQFISRPISVGDAIGRIRSNVAYFTVNYAIVIVLILFLSLLWNPISLMMFFVVMALWLFLYFLREEPLVVFGRSIDDRTVLIALSVVTIFSLLLTHATGNVIGSVLIAAAIVVIHAGARIAGDLVDEESGDRTRLLSSSTVPPSSSSSSL